MSDNQWIGVEDVAAEMKYTTRQAWEFIRSIGLMTVNARKMESVRFTRAAFEEARERALAPIAPRSRTGAVPEAVRSEAAVPKRDRRTNPVALAASKAAKLRGA